MTRRRVTVLVFAVLGAVIGALVGMLVAPHSVSYQASANVVVVPAGDVGPDEASAYWEVLTQGQVSRTAAILYGDQRWIPVAANAAKVQPAELATTAVALPETTAVMVTVTAGSSGEAESALNGLLTAATPDVSSLVAPYLVKVLWPPAGNAVQLPRPAGTQFIGAGLMGGLLMGGGLGWLIWLARRGSARPGLHQGAGGEMPTR